jgi:hypothetical protein
MHHNKYVVFWSPHQLPYEPPPPFSDAGERGQPFPPPPHGSGVPFSPPVLTIVLRPQVFPSRLTKPTSYDYVGGGGGSVYVIALK